MHPAGPSWASYLAAPLSWLYALGWEAYEAVYTLGLKQQQEPHRPVVCIGNLQVGGTGKSPLVARIASLLQSMGREVVISASGYGSQMAHGAQLAPEGELDARIWGDEPAMFRWLQETAHLPIIVGRRRTLAARICHEQFPLAILLMDDGFQHLPIKKHLSIVLDPPVGNCFCLPAGPYREPRNGLRRADLVIPGRFSAKRAEPTFIDTNGAPIVPPKCQAVRVLCALGKPEGFIQSLQSIGLQITSSRLLRDHDPLDAGTLLEAIPADSPLVVTAKDWVKLRERGDLAGREIWITKTEISIEPELEFATWLQERLAEIEA